MRGESEASALRVLLIAELEPAERGLAEALKARGMRVEAVSGAVDALRVLRGDGADVVVLGLPLSTVDPIAACAALKEGPYAPLLVVGDLSDQAAALAAALPEACRPDAVVARPLEAMKLAMAIHECQQAASEGDEAGAGLGISLAELLIELKRRHSNEVLELRAGSVCTAIHLRDGDPIFAEGGSLQETLGRQLVRRGAIAHDDYVRVVARMTEGVIQHQSLRLGEVLVELGLLSPAEVYDALALQVREKIVACFQWESFDYELHEAIDESADLGIYQCPPVEALVLAGIRAHFGPERLAPILDPQASMIPVLRASSESLVPVFQPTAAEQKLLRAIDGTRTVDVLRRSRILDPVHAGQLLAALAAGCAVAFRKTPLPRAREGQAAAAGREAAQGGEARGARVRGQVGARRHSADPGSRSGAARTLRPARAAAPAHGPRARRGGGRSPRRRGSRPRTPSTRACACCARACCPGALREFRRAVELAPHEPEYRLLEAWLEYRSEKSGEARALAASKVRACAQLVLQASRTSARAHSVHRPARPPGGRRRGRREAPAGGAALRRARRRGQPLPAHPREAQAAA